MRSSWVRLPTFASKIFLSLLQRAAPSSLSQPGPVTFSTPGCALLTRSTVDGIKGGGWGGIDGPWGLALSSGVCPSDPPSCPSKGGVVSCLWRVHAFTARVHASTFHVYVHGSSSYDKALSVTVSIWTGAQLLRAAGYRGITPGRVPPPETDSTPPAHHTCANFPSVRGRRRIRNPI